jgi:hypothetical protein
MVQISFDTVLDNHDLKPILLKQAIAGEVTGVIDTTALWDQTQWKAATAPAATQPAK